MELNKFKTNLCKHPDTCKFGDKCAFAHSYEELRKTKMCEYGDSCKNDKKCRFAHNSSELFDFEAAISAENNKKAEKNIYDKSSFAKRNVGVECAIVDEPRKFKPKYIKTRREPSDRKKTIQIDENSPVFKPIPVAAPPVQAPVAVSAPKISSSISSISSSFTSRSVQTDDVSYFLKGSQTDETRIANPNSGIIKERAIDLFNEWRQNEIERRKSHPPSPEISPSGLQFKKVVFERSKSDPSPNPSKSSFTSFNSPKTPDTDFNKLIDKVVSYRDIPEPINTNSSLEYSMLIDEFNSYETSPTRMAELVQLAHQLHARKTEIMPIDVAKNWAEHDEWQNRPLSPVFSKTRPPTPIENKDTSRFFQLTPEFASVFKEMV